MSDMSIIAIQQHLRVIGDQPLASPMRVLLYCDNTHVGHVIWQILTRGMGLFRGVFENMG
jgi:hypothetical protein